MKGVAPDPTGQFTPTPPLAPRPDVGYEPPTEPKDDGIHFTPDDSQALAPVIPFTPDTSDEAMDAQFGTVRPWNLQEKAGYYWEKYTGHLFSSGPKSVLVQHEGFPLTWPEVPVMWGGMAVEQLLNPGNILGGIFTGAMGPAAMKAVGKAAGAYMMGSGLLQVHQLDEELKNPEVGAPQKVADVGAVAGQVALGRFAWGKVGSTHAEQGVTSLANAMKAMKPDDAGELLAKLHGATPQELARLLQAEAHKAPPAIAEHLNEAARHFQKLDKLQPTEVKELNEAQKAWDEVKRVFAPASRGPNAEITAGALREMGGELAQRTDRAEAALEKTSKILMKMAPEYRWDSVDRIERGTEQATPELQQWADTVRQIFDSRRREIQALGTGELEHYINDYFAHIWEDPEKASSAFQVAAAKAPLQGSKSFLKERSIPTIKEGREMGLTPVSENPVDIVLLAARQMDKYITAQKWVMEMKGRGLLSFVRAGEIPPEGYTAINDPIATVYGPRTGAVSLPDGANIEPEDVTVHGKRIMGQYYAPDEVAAVANNYLSPGLRKFATYRAYMSAANVLNRFQLGFSAFHLGFTSVDTSISKLALAIEYAGQNRLLKAATKIAQVPFAPITNLLEGNRVVSEWMRPGSQGAEYAQITDALRQAGASVKMDKAYQTAFTKHMQELWTKGTTGGKVGAIWRAPFAAMEQVSKPLMEYVVPRQKLGVASDMIRMEKDRLPGNATPDQMRAVYDKVWDSVDNRMGQMVYDNLFWNKTVKDVLMASVRSVGWDLGTIRELGGGVADTGAFLKDTLTPSKKAELTHRMAYTISLPILTGLIGATYQYLRTGKGPQEPRDYYFPKTGEKDPQGRDVRMNLPTYMKDVYHYEHDAWGTITSKLTPFPVMVVQMLNNKDYFGRDIRNADDPLVQQMMQEAKYMAGEVMPIGIRQYEVSEAAGQTKSEMAGAFVGVTRAPAWVGESTAEQLAGKLAGDKFKSRESPDSELVAKKQKIQIALRNGTGEEKLAAREQLAAMVESGDMTNAQLRNFMRGTEHTYLENAVRHLGGEDAMRVFKKATPEERAAIAAQVRIEILHVHAEEDRKRLLEEFERLTAKKDDDDTNAMTTR